MAFATMHFATGMVCSGALGLGVCGLARKGFRWLPLVITVGGFWGMVPDMPRLWREDFFRGTPGAQYLGSKALEATLHRNGDIFFFHHWLDTHRTEDRYALHGMAIMIACYLACILLLMYLEWRARHSEANQFWQTHKPYLDRTRAALDASRGAPAAGAAAPTPTPAPRPPATPSDLIVDADLLQSPPPSSTG